MCVRGLLLSLLVLSLSSSGILSSRILRADDELGTKSCKLQLHVEDFPQLDGKFNASSVIDVVVVLRYSQLRDDGSSATIHGYLVANQPASEQQLADARQQHRKTNYDPPHVPLHLPMRLVSSSQALLGKPRSWRVAHAKVWGRLMECHGPCMPGSPLGQGYQR